MATVVSLFPRTLQEGPGISVPVELELRRDIRDYLGNYNWVGAIVTGKTLIAMFATPRGITIKGNPQWLAILCSEAETCGWKKIPDPKNPKWYAFERQASGLSEDQEPSITINTCLLYTSDAADE